MTCCYPVPRHPRHAAHQLHAYSEVHVVTEIVLVIVMMVMVDNADFLPVEITNPSNLELLMTEQLPTGQWPNRTRAECTPNKVCCIIKIQLSGLQDYFQLAVPVNRREEVIKLVHQILTGGHMRAQKTRERLNFSSLI